MLLTMAVLFGFCDVAQAVRVKFVFPQSYELHIYTTQTTTFYDADGSMTDKSMMVSEREDLESSDWVELEGVDNYVDEYYEYHIEQGRTVKVNGNTITITDVDGSYWFVNYTYSWKYTRRGGGNTLEGDDITDQVVEGATIDLTKYFPADYIVTVNIIDTDGTPQDDIQVSLRSDSYYYYYYESTENGTAIFTIPEGKYDIEVRDRSMDQRYIEETIEVSEDMTVTYTIPKMISFDVTIDGMTLAQIHKKGYFETSSPVKIVTLDYENRQPTVYKEGKLYSRLDPNKEYRMYSGLFESKEYDDEGYVKGSTKITDGCTIRIGTFNVQTEGEGLAFPREEFAGNSSYKVFVGDPVRLAAVPVGDKEFVSWTINGKEYANPMMDFTVKDDITTATAKFSGEILTQVKAADSSIETISVQVEGNYLVLPADVEATACLYSADGRLVKRTGVVGNKINISDLPASAYILRLNAEGLFQTAQFVKK